MQGVQGVGKRAQRPRPWRWASLALAVLVACAEAPPPSIDTAFVRVDGARLTLRRDALGTPFLLTPRVVVSGVAPRVQALLPKVVAFELHGDTLALVQRNLGAVHDELPGGRLLDTFPVEARGPATVTFRWEQALARVTPGSPVVVSDWPATLEAMLAPQEATLAPVTSVLIRAAFVDGGLELTQLARLRLPTGEELGVELHNRLAPRAPAPGFTLRQGGLAEGVGYFEVPRVRKGQGSFEMLATRWDLQQGPITYAITGNTPALLVDAVASGIDYWNRVAGAEVVRVERGAAPEVVGGTRRVMVRWIPFAGGTDAASAVQPDPATGEIVAADIHVTSAFAASAAQTLAMARVMGPEPGPAVAAPGFQPAATCRFTADPVSLWSELAAAGGRGAVDGLALAAMQDYVRLVVAHEVGHTLGLRHNFAGSLASELHTAAERAKAWQAYTGGRSRRGAAVSATVMDYIGAADSLLLGAAIAHQTLPYDRAAWAWGYDPRQPQANQLALPLFCSDVEAQLAPVATAGCRLWDSGPTPLAAHVETLAAPERLGDALAVFWAAAVPNGRGVVEAAGTLDPNRLLEGRLLAAREIFAASSVGARDLAVDRRLGGRTWLNAAAYDAATVAAQADALAAVGGLPGIVQAAVPTGADGAPAAPGWLLRALRRAVTDLRLPPALAAALDAAAPEVTATLEELYLERLLRALTGADQPDAAFAPGVVAASWEAPLAALAEALVSQPIHGLPVRLAATRLLSPRLFGTPGWLAETRAALVARLEARLAALTPLGATDDLAAWRRADRERAVLAAVRRAGVENDLPDAAKPDALRRGVSTF
jgi:hypothetical protein